MAQLAIYVDDQTVRAIKKHSKQAGLSRSEWVSSLIHKEVSQEIPEKFFQILGTWEDDRSPQKILKDIRKHSSQKKRTSLR